MKPHDSADKAAPCGWMQRLVRCSSFLLFVGSPFAEANPCRLAPGDGLKLVHGILHGVSSSWNIETKQTNPIIRNLNLFVPSLGSLHIQLPLLHGDLAGDVINDAPLFGFTGSTGVHYGNERGNERPDNNSKSAEDGELDCGIKRVEYHLLFWFLYGAGSVMLGLWIGAIISRWWIDAIWGGPIFLTNV